MITLAHQDHPDLSLVQLCELHGVSRSWYYEQSTRPEQEVQDIALRDQIEHILLEFSGYGYRRITHALARQGCIVNHKRVLRIMRGASRYCVISKRSLWSPQRIRATDAPVYPNVLAAMTLTAPDQAWVADFTYIRPAQARLCTWRVCWMRFHVVVWAGICRER